VRQHGCRLVHASTSEVYGDGAGSEINEESSLVPHSPYAATKLAAEHLVLSYIHTYGIKATVVRMFNAYGPGQSFEKVIPMFVCSALCGLPLPMQGDGSATRDWTYVDDACKRLEDLSTRQAPFIFCNAGSGEQKSIKELAQRISLLAGMSSPNIERLLERPGSVRNQSADVRNAKKYFGETAVPIELGLALTYEWYRDRIAQWRPRFLEARAGLLEEMRNASKLTLDRN
jgi:dTDP-glucose 4,6-dehydratase